MWDQPTPLEDRASFLSAEQRQAMVGVWRDYALGEVGRSHRRVLAAQERLPPAWRAAFERGFALLDPWREQVAGQEAAADRLVEAIVMRLHKANWALSQDPEHPRHSALHRSMAEVEQFPIPAFGEQSPYILQGLVEGASRGEERFGHLLAISRERSAERLDKPLVDEQETLTRAQEDETLRETTLERWREVRDTQINTYEMQALLAALESLGVELEQKRSAMARITRLLGLGLEDVARGSDWSSGFWRDDMWSILESYAEQLESNPSLRRLAEMLGRYEEDEEITILKEMEERQAVRRARTLRGGRSEIKGLHRSADLDRVTAADLALLASPETELLFYARFLERQLLTYEMAGRAWFNEERKVLRLRPVRDSESRKGPILLCIDTSGSMTGTPETVAKTLSMAILKVALRERRPCLAISFSSANDIRELELSAFPKSLGPLVSFLAGGFYGGTDPGPALDRAMQYIESGTFQRADVLIITDGLFDLGDTFPARFEAAKARMDFRLHGLIVGAHGRDDTLPFADFQWVWREHSGLEGSAELVRKLRHTG